MTRLSTFVLLLVLLAMRAAAYVSIDLGQQVSTTTPADHIQTTVEGITLDYYKNTNTRNPAGATLAEYSWTDMYKLKLTSANGKDIIAVELDGKTLPSTTRGSVMIEEIGGGNLEHHANSISVWTGRARSLRFACGTQSSYNVQRIRVWFDGETYTPTQPTDEEETEQEEILIGKPMVRPVSTPHNGQAVKMAIVSIRKFRTQVQNYALWKTKQGYDVTEVYVEDNNANGALTGNALALRLQARLKEIHPTFVLIMGDHEQVPAFVGTINYKQKSGWRTDYVTDYFYGEYSDEYTVPYQGNYAPEAYVGRFSGWEAEDIEAQMNKTEQMARLASNGASWLNNSLCILSDDPSDNTIKRGHDYVVKYLESKVESKVQSVGPTALTINNAINSGCAFVSYYGHGNTGELDTYGLQNAAALRNEGRYPILMAMTCLSGLFDNGSRNVMCLAERMQRMPRAGTVAYVGATRESYLDMHFMTGGTSNDGQSYLGFMRSMFPTSAEDPLNQHARTLGEAVAIARYGIRYVGWTALAREAQEYHELFGDPTYMPYIRTPQTMQPVYPASVMAGCAFSVQTAPHAVVCISRDRTIVAVTLADAQGHAYLTADATAAPGTYTFYCSAPGYTDYESTITLRAFDNKGVTPSTFDFNTYARKRVLIEKFTGQQCSYCTDAEYTTRDYVETNKDRVYEMRHFSYGSDRIASSYLKMDFHATLFNAWEFSGHPTYMVDRAGYRGSSSATSDGYKATPEEIVANDRVGDRWDTPCQVSLSLDGTTYDPDTRLLRVVVSGKAKEALPDLCINLFLTQNKMNARQVGYGMYEHNGVSRAYLTRQVTGDALTTHPDGSFQAIYYYELPTQLGYFPTVIQDMDIVAFVSSWDNYAYTRNKNGKDYNNSQIYNTEVLRLADAPQRAHLPTLPGAIITGDVNGDGRVNIADLAALISLLLGKDNPRYNRQAADMDRSNTITLQDQKLLLQRILQ